MSMLYSFLRRYSSTSNCSTPTAPTMTSSMPLFGSWKIWMAPSCAIWVTPLTNCLRFMVSTCEITEKCSGANVGMPSKRTRSFGSQIVSPMEKMPGSNTPMMSPA